MHATPYSESSVVAKVFTRHLGLRSYIIKGVRGRSGKVKQNLLQPLSALDMVVYDNPRTELNYIKEISPRHPEAFMQQDNHAVAHSLRFFMTEVLYKDFPNSPSLFSSPSPATWASSLWTTAAHARLCSIFMRAVSSPPLPRPPSLPISPKPSTTTLIRHSLLSIFHLMSALHLSMP